MLNLLESKYMVKKNVDKVEVAATPEMETSGEQNINNTPKRFRKLGPKRVLLIILVLVAICGVYGSVYFYKKYQTLKVDPTIEAQKETTRLVEVLGKLMELPTGENPTVATISDKEKLKGQTFFTNAENGDILFAYTTAMQAILYRPSTNKIVNVAPISINSSQNLTGTSQKNTPATDKKTN